MINFLGEKNAYQIFSSVKSDKNLDTLHTL